ncbi:MAG: GNAT family N-acetyltransferase, partial [Candidatus Cryptobacteroides sp.]
MNIRKSRKEDIPSMQEIFAYARNFMRNTGNPDQWADNYPSTALLESDIESGDSYVVEEGGEIIATFVLRPGIDPTYN